MTDVRVERTLARWSVMLAGHRIWCTLLESPLLAGLHGRYIPTSGSLQISSSGTSGIRRTTFVHEILHAIEQLGGIDLKEDRIQAISPLLSCLLAESPVGLWLANLKADPGDGSFRILGAGCRMVLVDSANMQHNSLSTNEVIWVDRGLSADRQKVEVVKQILLLHSRLTDSRMPPRTAATIALYMVLLFGDNPRTAQWLCLQAQLPGLPKEESDEL